MNEWKNEWMSEWVSEWVSDWVTEWLSDWMNQWMNDNYHKSSIAIHRPLTHSRLVVNEDDLKWVANLKKVSVIIKTIPCKFPFKNYIFGDLKWCFDASWGLKLKKILRWWIPYLRLSLVVQRSHFDDCCWAQYIPSRPRKLPCICAEPHQLRLCIPHHQQCTRWSQKGGCHLQGHRLKKRGK